MGNSLVETAILCRDVRLMMLLCFRTAFDELFRREPPIKRLLDWSVGFNDA